MAYNLIPFPISMLFFFVFGLTWIAVTWKLRKKGRFYSILFKLSFVVILLSFTLMFYSLIGESLLKNAPTHQNPQPLPQPT